MAVMLTDSFLTKGEIIWREWLNDVSWPVCTRYSPQVLTLGLTERCSDGRGMWRRSTRRQRNIFWTIKPLMRISPTLDSNKKETQMKILFFVLFFLWLNPCCLTFFDKLHSAFLQVYSFALKSFAEGRLLEVSWSLKWGGKGKKIGGL